MAAATGRFACSNPSPGRCQFGGMVDTNGDICQSCRNQESIMFGQYALLPVPSAPGLNPDFQGPLVDTPGQFWCANRYVGGCKGNDNGMVDVEGTICQTCENYKRDHDGGLGLSGDDAIFGAHAMIRRGAGVGWRAQTFEGAEKKPLPDGLVDPPFGRGLQPPRRAYDPSLPRRS